MNDRSFLCSRFPFRRALIPPDHALARCGRTCLLTLGLAAGWMLLPGCLNWSSDYAYYRTHLDAAAGLKPRDASPAAPPLAFDPAAPLSLPAALLQADRDNEAIALAGENYIQALAEKMRLAGTFLPTLSLAPGYGLSHAGRGGTTEQLTASFQASASGSLSDLSDQAAAEQIALERGWLLLHQREAVLLSVATAYYQVLRFERQIDVLTRSIERQTESLREQTARLALGSGRDLDVAQSRAELAGARATLTQARIDRAGARIALGRLLGVSDITGPLAELTAPPILFSPASAASSVDSSEPSDSPDSREPPGSPKPIESPESLHLPLSGSIGQQDESDPAPTAPLDSLLESARTQRQDLQATAHAVEAARRGVDAAIRAYYPSISINFNYFLLNDPGPSGAWTGGISLNLPLFSALRIEAGIRAAWSRYRQAALAELATWRDAEAAIREAWQNLRGSELRRTELEIQVAAATRAFQLAEQSFSLGRGSHLERLIAQDNLLSAELELANERDQAHLWALKLLRETGQLATWMVRHSRPEINP